MNGPTLLSCGLDEEEALEATTTGLVVEAIFLDEILWPKGEARAVALEETPLKRVAEGTRLIATDSLRRDAVDIVLLLLSII